MNKILKELITFCEAECLGVLEFKLSTPNTPSTAKVLNIKDIEKRAYRLKFNGKWRYVK